MATNSDNPYNVPPNFAPYGNSGVGPQNPNAGNTGEPWGAQYASYGLRGQRNGVLQSAIVAVERDAQHMTATFYRGIPGDEKAVYYDLLTPQTYMRGTVAQPENSQNISGPVQPLSIRP